MDDDFVYVKCFSNKGDGEEDVFFKAKVSRDVSLKQLSQLRCFVERYMNVFYLKDTEEKIESLKEEEKNTLELGATFGGFSDTDNLGPGVLYVAHDDGVLRQSDCVPLSRPCVMMSLWKMSHEECEKIFSPSFFFFFATLEELEVSWCSLRSVPSDLGKMTHLKKLILVGLQETSVLPEEIGLLSQLRHLELICCSSLVSLPLGLKNLNSLKHLKLSVLPLLQLQPHDVASFAKLNHLHIRSCDTSLSSLLFVSTFWDMIQSVTTDIRFFDLDRAMLKDDDDPQRVTRALQGNGSIVESGLLSEQYTWIWERNRANHEKARECVVLVLAMRKWRNALNVFPKEMVRMIATMLWNTKCDVNAWSKR